MLVLTSAKRLKGMLQQPAFLLHLVGVCEQEDNLLSAVRLL